MKDSHGLGKKTKKAKKTSTKNDIFFSKPLRSLSENKKKTPSTLTLTIVLPPPKPGKPSAPNSLGHPPLSYRVP